MNRRIPLYALAFTLFAALGLGAFATGSRAAETAVAAAVPAGGSDIPHTATDEDTAIDPGAEAAAKAPYPPGDEGDLIKYGHDLLTDTQKLMPENVGAGMNCDACHLEAGKKPHAGSLMGLYSRFPQWNKRSSRFIALQDRLAECFLYSMNGKPPAYDSREMIALTAYIAFLSRGSKVGSGFAGQKLIDFDPPHTPDPAAGATVFSAKCQTCHGADGAGRPGVFPPLWGAKSFNGGAGMHRVTTMAAFVRYNMPLGSAPDTLSAQEAYDVSAYVLSHERPAFDGAKMVEFPAQPAKHF